jgi:hypothetical protein
MAVRPFFAGFGSLIDIGVLRGVVIKASLLAAAVVNSHKSKRRPRLF